MYCIQVTVCIPFHHPSAFHSTVCLYSVPPQDESIGPDPFYDLEQHALLGVANISLECLLHDIDFMYDAPIVAPTGKVWTGGGLCGVVLTLSSHSRYVES